MGTMAVAGQSNVAVAARELPFLKYRVDSVARPEHDGRMSADEMLKALDLDFEVVKRKVYTHTPKGHRVTIPGTFANVRTDTETFLGITGDRYQIVQNSVLGGLGDALLDTGEANGESGWSLRGGRTVGLTFAVPGADIAVPGDGGGVLPMFLMLSNSHDGNSSVSGFVGPVRVACVNMIRLFIRSAVSSFKIRHTSGVEGKIAAMRDALGLTMRYKIAAEEKFDQLLNTTLVESQVNDILRAAFPIREAASDAQRENSVQAALMRNWLTSPTIAEVRETGYGLMNAVNEWYEHLQPVRSRSFDADSVRGISILQGSAFVATNRVVQAIEEFAA